MTELVSGPIGVVVGRPGDDDVFLDAATVLEELGYATIWLAGPSISGFEQVRNMVAATRNVQIAGGVISVDQFDAVEVADWYAELEATHPSRFIVGLGGAHGPKPLQTISSYLDALDTGPPPCRQPHASWRRSGPACSTWPVSGRLARTRCWSRPNTTRGRVRCWARTPRWL